ncbi:ABC transporter substrate-binding protein [Flexivirga oryzae]|uniref:Polar amino acid transport system substrate-binding protein n=1 Tax=Flexivirga oryzae TaxID=1794944 RepID=A0A839MXF1_9MICO|nr:ABC transporter substrate-binding protein [Flexivirga oryzae]MBB2890130.1 polar amino acid transport system substrate-binding protein [Flexivirga oryzae]
MSRRLGNRSGASIRARSSRYSATRRGWPMVLAGGLVASLLAGCGATSLGLGTSEQQSATTGCSSGGVQSALPSTVQPGSTITVASDASYEPNEFLAPDGQTIIGMDIDLLRGALQCLGLKVKFQNAKFDNILPGIVGGKYDMGASSFTITAARLRQVTMVSYFSAGTQWITQKGNPKKFNPTKPCGHSVGVQTGTTQADEIAAINKGVCKSDHVKPVVEDLQSKVTTDLLAGKVDAMAADSPVALYAVKKTGDKLQAVGDITGSAPYGIVLPKSQDKFGVAIAKAFAAMATNGSYQKILAKWGQQSGAVEMFAANPAVPND